MDRTALHENDNLEQLVIAQLSDSNRPDWFTSYTIAFRELMAYYRCAMVEVAARFDVLDQEFSLKFDHNPIEAVKTRLKAPQSIFDKLRRHQQAMTIDSIEENLSDVAGVRIICAFTSDIYALADAFLKQDDIKLLYRKDYIRSPKENGYRSLHLIVETPIYLLDHKRSMKVEVQLRTIAMDWWASLEHKITYKKDLALPEEAYRQLTACAEAAAALDNRMESIALTARFLEADKYKDATAEMTGSEDRNADQ